MRKILLVSLLTAILISANPLQAESLPDYAFVDGFVGHGQTYPLSCESRSAADLAGYWGLQVSETEFFHNLPTSDNPEVGFVGSVYGTWGQIPPNAYGVHAQPIAKLLREYGLDAQPQKGMTMRQLKTEIANGRPVLVWVIGHVWAGTPVSYTAHDGSVVTVAAYEHSMVAYGYDSSAIYLVDAGTGGKAAYATSNFRASWGVLGNLAVTATGKIGEDVVIPPVSSGNHGETYIVQPGDYLSSLASRWGISWQDLAALNGITYPYVIFPGQVLYTGLGAAPTPAPTEAPDTDQQPSPTAQPTSTPRPTPKPISAPEEVYNVQQGDDLMQIAKDLGMDWRDIVSLNGLTYPYLVYPGQVLILTGSPAQAGQEGSTQEGTPETYVVQPGEHLLSIARKFDLDWMELATLNNLEAPYTLSPGQKLILPGGDGTPAPQPESQTPNDVSEFSGTVYICQPGDYLYALARTFGISWQALASYNNIPYPYIVYPGQEITIP